MYFWEEILQKYDNGEHIDKEDLEELIWEYEICREHGDSSRWVQGIKSIIKLGERYFSITWAQGLTEMQEDEFWDSEMTEVIPHIVEKTITCLEWKEKR